MTSITKSKKPIQTTDGDTVKVHKTIEDKISLWIGEAWYVLSADSASRLAIELRLMAIEVEKGEGR